MSRKNTRKTAKAERVERIYQELNEISAQAQREETLTAMGAF